MIEFVSYTGKYPNLCNGILTLNIDGKLVEFGHDYTKSWEELEKDNPPFWQSGGNCGIRVDGDEYCEDGPWEIDEERIPEEYKKYAKEIRKIFNENVQFGCCGGCI